MQTVKQVFQVKQLYVLITDEACHDYLVPKEQAKECKIKQVANKWKGQIDSRVHVAMMNYQVEITD